MTLGSVLLMVGGRRRFGGLGITRSRKVKGKELLQATCSCTEKEK